MNIFFHVDGKILMAKLLFNFKTLKDLICVKLITPYKTLKAHIIFSKIEDRWNCEDIEMEELYPAAMTEICLRLNEYFSEVPEEK